MAESKIATIDTETHLIAPGLLAPPPVCLQFAENEGPIGVAVCGADPVEEIFGSFLMEPGTIIVGQNIAYDMLVLGRAYPKRMPLIFQAYEQNRITDTIVREKLLLIANGTYWRLKVNGFALANLAKRYKCHKGSEDPWRLRYGELQGIPFDKWPKEAQQYATNDIVATRKVYYGQEAKAVAMEYPLPDQYHQSRAAWFLHLAGAQGVKTDPSSIQFFEESERRAFEQDKARCQREGLVSAKGTRNMATAQNRMKRIMESKGLKWKKTPTGKASVDEESCIKAGDETLLAFQRYGSRNSLLTRIQSLKAGVDGVINPFFDSLIETGRTSCRKGRPGAPTNGYQIQNMRRAAGERECFIPRPGNVFIGCDYDTMELRTLAQVCLWALGNSRLGEAIKAGLDPHLALASEMLGIEYQEADLILNGSSPAEFPTSRERVKEARQGAKVANFGFPGGMGANAFKDYAKGYGLELTLEDAENLKENWLNTWPEMGQYFGWINTFPWRQEARGEHIKSITDIEQFVSLRRRGSITYTVACNTFFQALAADAAKAAGFALAKACEMGSLKGWGIWNFIHDEFILEGPMLDGARAAGVVASIMVDAAQPWVPDIPLSATPCLMNRWSKKAEPVYKDGVLVPWGS